MKTCPACNNDLDDSKFYFSKKTYDGLSSYCRECSKKRTAAWRRAHPARVKELARAHNSARAKKQRRCIICKVSLVKGVSTRRCPRCIEQARIKANLADRQRAKRNNPVKYHMDRLASMRRRIARHKAFLNEYKTLHPCACGESDPVALDFHHIDPVKKNGEMKRLAVKGMEFIQNEIEKCIVLCANCHRKGHAGRPRPEHIKFFPTPASVSV